MGDPFAYSKAPLKRVKCMQFGVFSPDELRSMSVTQQTIVSNKRVDAGITRIEGVINGQPMYGGIKDPRLGPNAKGDKCKSCEGDRHTCPGHFGHIELARPMFHIGFITECLKILKCVCFYCARLLAGEDDEKLKQKMRIKDGKRRLKAVHDICRGKKKCEASSPGADELDENNEAKKFISGTQACGRTQPSYRTNGPYAITVEYPKDCADDDVLDGGDRKQNLSARRVHDIFQRISDKDCVTMGLNPRWARPDWMVLTVFPVPPPHVRPSVALDASSTGEDDLTFHLAAIVKVSLRHDQIALRCIEEVVGTRMAGVAWVGCRFAAGF
jgi:DNA-directed RNA polymerase II subunit RPB1